MVWTLAAQVAGSVIGLVLVLLVAALVFSAIIWCIVWVWKKTMSLLTAKELKTCKSDTYQNYMPVYEPGQLAQTQPLGYVQDDYRQTDSRG
jgi:hypothetical protein